jgi:AP-3 complex subunit beta
LLSDRTTLVVGSAVMAFEEVCPERIELVHKNYRKLCNLLVDVDEWGQVLIINMLTRYARTQFTDPNIEEEIASDQEDKPFYDGSSESEKSTKKQSYSLDQDHRLLLRQTKPLLQSRNSAVVMAVAQLYHHIAPTKDVSLVAKALVRLLRSRKEVQSIVLTCIASMSVNRKQIFELYLKSFFVRTSDDPTHIKLLKLDIMTNLATEASIAIILREFQTYVQSNDKDFVAATIQAIGKCAATISEVTETCLSGLVHLLSNHNEYVVAESVVVIKKLLQSNETQQHKQRIITQMSKLLDFITVPAARASILWLIGEYNEHVPKIAPDVLRKLAKSFCDEETSVKLQTLNLAVKLMITNPQQTSALAQHVFNLARYDTHYDVRDRARFLKPFISTNGDMRTFLLRNSKQIFLASKPAPQIENRYTGRENFQLGSMSHYLNMRVNRYLDLPNFPEIAPDNSVRNFDSPVHVAKEEEIKTKTTTQKTNQKNKKNTKSFYSDESSSVDSSTSSSSSESESESENEKSKVKNGKVKENNIDGTEDSESDSSSSESSSSSSESEDEPDNVLITTNNNHKSQPQTPSSNDKKIPTKSNLDLLLDLDEMAPISSNVMTPSMGGFLTPITPSTSNIANRIETVGPSYIATDTSELLNKVNGYGLGITYKFTRSPHLYSSSMVSIELHFTNHSNVELTDIQIGMKNLTSGMSMHEFAPISNLASKQSVMNFLGIDFNDSSQAANFEIKSSGGTSKVTMKPSVGELIRSVTMPEAMFMEERNKLRGMTESSCKTTIRMEFQERRQLQMKIHQIANVASIVSETNLLFAGQTLSSKSLVLITIAFEDNDKVSITVNCEKLVVGSILMNEIKDAIKKI